MKKKLGWNIAIIGAGKVGQVLGRVLVENGDRVVAVVSRTQGSARRGGEFLQCRNYGVDLPLIPPAIDVVFITTPHAAVEEVVRGLSELGGLPWKRISVCHASGMMTAGVLAPLHRKGACTFSFHPLQTFPRDFAPKDIVPNVRGIYYGVDGSKRGIERAKQLARKLSGKVIEVSPGKRAYYHAACVVASNHLTALLAIVETMYSRFGKKTPGFYTSFEPIILATLSNIKRSSPKEALSGPVARGGVETVREHFEAIREHSPELLPYFARMTEESIYLATKKRSIDNEQRRALIKLVETYRTEFTH